MLSRVQIQKTIKALCSPKIAFIALTSSGSISRIPVGPTPQTPPRGFTCHTYICIVQSVYFQMGIFLHAGW